ncbi:MAG: DNA-directed RNA polymerase subunit alpha [Candidatus Wildermuthbacteria bacterium]|nr:DNA-directed RNA polymerase subunit alpha [Candidatus Wildermuthbacteria bacterium]
MIPLSHTTKVVSNEGNKGVFEIEALYPGYGVTLGNSLRRVLLSSLEGAAITHVKMKNVSHEFSGIPGVMEDMLGIILNLKQLRFRVYSDEPQKAVVRVKGEKEVRASDFDFPAQVEVINKNAPIARLTDKNAELDMEITVAKGVGYQAAESRKGGKEELGVMEIDSIYTPIQKVNYRVEQMRVGDRTDFDRLIVDVETDGTMSPETAFWQAAEILVKQFEIIRAGVTPEKTKVLDEKEQPEENAAGAEEKEDKPKKTKKAPAKKKK